ncbi:MAG: vanadium-dependent haloperoxidase [Mucilaginibacter sp.]
MRSVLILFASALLIFSSCKKPDYEKVLHDPTLYSRTVYELNSVVMGNNFSPPVASRNYAYASIAGYEVIAAGSGGKYKSLVGQLNGFTKVARPLADEQIDYPYAALLAFCKVGQTVTFPEGSLKYYTDSLHQLAVAHGMPEAMITVSEKFAKEVAASIMAWSKKDHYVQTRSASKFAIKDSAGRWVPTPPGYFEAVEPHWGEIRTMVMSDAKEYTVPPPPDFNITDKNSKYYKEVMLIKNTGDSLTAEQIHIADFWDDNPQKMNITGHVMFITKKFSPPGHWMSVVGIGAQKVNADYNTTVCAYAKTAIALFDGFIESWAAKFKYKTVRPETIVDKYFDPNWRPHLQTPPFPEYTCGHCTISAAAAEALSSVLGENVAYTDTTELEFGIKNRSFKSFKDAAMETAKSRFYGGIHFNNSCVVSSGFGKIVGDSVVKKLVMKQ